MFLVVLLIVGLGSWALGWVLDKAGDTLTDEGRFLHYIGLFLKILAFVIPTVGIGLAVNAARHPPGP